LENQQFGKQQLGQLNPFNQNKYPIEYFPDDTDNDKIEEDQDVNKNKTKSKKSKSSDKDNTENDDKDNKKENYDENNKSTKCKPCSDGVCREGETGVTIAELKDNGILNCMYKKDCDYTLRDCNNLLVDFAKNTSSDKDYINKFRCGLKKCYPNIENYAEYADEGGLNLKANNNNKTLTGSPQPIVTPVIQTQTATTATAPPATVTPATATPATAPPATAPPATATPATTIQTQSATTTATTPATTTQTQSTTNANANKTQTNANANTTANVNVNANTNTNVKPENVGQQ
jgi:hypothetical protein